MVGWALFSLIFSMASEHGELSREAVLGSWSGTETNGLSCRVEFDNEKGRVHTFRKGKHLTTVYFWWGIETNKTNIVLGVNGRAYPVGDGELQLELRPVNERIITVRDVRLKKVEASKAKP
jgi:hypothetical protein